MGNIIEFPMDRVRLSPTAEDIFSDLHQLGLRSPTAEDIFYDEILTQAFDLEQESLQMLAQAKAIEEQSQRVLDLMTDLENY